MSDKRSMVAEIMELLGHRDPDGPSRDVAILQIMTLLGHSYVSLRSGSDVEKKEAADYSDTAIKIPFVQQLRMSASLAVVSYGGGDGMGTSRQIAVIPMDAVKIRAHGFFGKMLVTVKALLAEAIETADSLKLDGQSIQAVNTPTDKLLDKAKFYFQLLNMFFHASFFPKRIDPGKEVSVGLFPLIGVFESIGFDFGPAADKTYLRDGRFSFHDQHVHSVTGASDLRLGSDMAKIGLSKDTPAAFAVLVAFDPETSDVEITFLVVLRGDLEAAADFAVTQSDNFANPSTFMSTFERETSTLPLNEGKAIYNTVIVMMKQIIQCLEDN